MPVNVNVSISFEADNAEAAEAAVADLSFPEGAAIHVSVLQTIVSGVADASGGVQPVEGIPGPPVEIGGGVEEIPVEEVPGGEVPAEAPVEEVPEAPAEAEPKPDDVLAVAAETLFGAVAALCSIIGIAMAVLSYIAGRRNAAEQAADDLHEKLIAEQRRSEELSAELHRIRMPLDEPWDRA